MVMALCIAAVHTAGAYATAADDAAPQITTEETVGATVMTEESDKAENDQVIDEALDKAEEKEPEITDSEVDFDYSEDEEEEQSTSDSADEVAAETFDETDKDSVVNELPEENAPDDNFRDMAEGEVVEETSEEESNEVLEKAATNNAVSEDESIVIEEDAVLEAVNSAQDQVENDLIETAIEFSNSNEAKAVNAKANMEELIHYLKTYGTYSNNRYLISSTNKTSGNTTYKTQIYFDTSENLVRFLFHTDYENSSIKFIQSTLEYDLVKKEFGPFKISCFTAKIPYYVAEADINPATYLPNQTLTFTLGNNIGFSNQQDLVNNLSSDYLITSMLAWESLLIKKPLMCLYALGFNKYIIPDFVDYSLSSTSYTHTGKEIKAPVSVMYVRYALEEGVHYELDYKNNIDVGTATASVNAIGNLFGSKELSYAILPAASKKVTIYNVAQGIKVTWLPVEGSTRYKVYRDGELIKTTSVLEITDGDVKYRSGEKFTYKVVATAKNVGDSLVARTGTYYRLMPVGIKTVTNSGAGKMTVTYDKSAGSSGYVVRYGLKSDMSDAKVITVKGEDTLSRTFSNLTKGKTYYVQVRTYKIDNGIRYYSGYCTTKTVKIVK